MIHFETRLSASELPVPNKFFPGCPLCHRADDLVVLEQVPDMSVLETKRSYPRWQNPNFFCKPCSLPFEFDQDTQKFAPHGVSNARDELLHANYDDFLGPGDADWAWTEALNRVASARKHDPGPDAFEFYGYLKRAGTWTMKAWLATHNRAPDRRWRYDESCHELGIRAGWDAMRVFQDFGRRVTRLLHGQQPSGDKPRSLSHPERRDFANAYVEEVLELHRWMRHGGPLPRVYSVVVRIQEEAKLSPRQSEWIPTRQLRSNANSMERLVAGLSEEVLRLDFIVDGRVLAVAYGDDWDDRSPYVVVRVPWNGLWWEELSPDASTDLEHSFTDLALPWSARRPVPPAGAWVRITPHGEDIEGTSPESSLTRERWLSKLPRLDKKAKLDIHYSFRLLPPLQPSLNKLVLPECDDEDYPDPPGIWFEFLDSPELVKFFEYGYCIRVSPKLPDKVKKLKLLYYCYHDPADVEFFHAFVHFDQSSGTVLWQDVHLDGAGPPGRRLGPTLALPANFFDGKPDSAEPSS